MPADYATDFSFLGDIGSTLGNMVGKYPELKAIDQENRDRKEFKQETFDAATNILSNIEGENLERYAASAGMSPEQARQHLMSEVDRLAPKESEDSDSYYNRVNKAVSNISTSGVNLEAVGHMIANGFELTEEAKADYSERKLTKQYQGFVDADHKTLEESRMDARARGLDDNSAIVKGKYDRVGSVENKAIQDKALGEVEKLLSGKSTKVLEDGTEVPTQLTYSEFMSKALKTVPPEKREYVMPVIESKWKENVYDIETRETELKDKLAIAKAGGDRWDKTLAAIQKGTTQLQSEVESLERKLEGSNDKPEQSRLKFRIGKLRKRIEIKESLNERYALGDLSNEQYLIELDKAERKGLPNVASGAPVAVTEDFNDTPLSMSTRQAEERYGEGYKGSKTGDVIGPDGKSVGHFSKTWNKWSESPSEEYAKREAASPFSNSAETGKQADSFIP